MFCFVLFGGFSFGFFFVGQGRFSFVWFCFLVEMSNAHLDILGFRLGAEMRSSCQE